MVKALLIDLDGTLVDSHPALYQVYNKFLTQYGKTGSKEEFKTLIGPSIDEIVAYLQKKHDIKAEPKDLSLMYVSLIMMQGFQGTELFPQAKEVLEAAKKKGIKLALVTSGTKPLVEMCLKPLKVFEAFDVIVTSEDVKKAKPNPEMYQLALSKLQVKPNEAYAVEDSEKGIKAAKDAGLKVLFLTHGEKEASKKENGVDLVSNWSEISKWLQSNTK